jgi:hypothetical protein
MSELGDKGIRDLEKTATALSINQSKAAAACWICLDDLPDQHGHLPVRNCSCRGEDAGFAHISCTVEYAERKSSERHCESDPHEFAPPWFICPNCDQPYDGQLATDLANKMVSFAERNYSTFDWRRLSAYQVKITRINELERSDETKKLMGLSIEICEKLLKTPVTAIPIHPADVLSLVAMAYETIGMSEAKRGDRNMREDILFQGIKYLERAKEINQQCHNHTQITQLEANIMLFQVSAREEKVCSKTIKQIGSVQRKITEDAKKELYVHCKESWRG